jgi:hypothetical protein
VWHPASLPVAANNKASRLNNRKEEPMSRLTNWLAPVAALALGLAAGAQTNAASLPIIGVKTDVEVTAPLGALGLTPAPFGSATAVGAIFTFPVTGGSVDSLSGAALIEHAGSGVALTAGTQSAFVGNFLIDTAAGSVFADGAALGLPGFLNAPIFNLGTGTELPGVELIITSTLASVLTAVFGAPDLTGVTFGYARPDVAVVPVPAAGLLLLSGMGALGAVRLRRRISAD